jgi:hypothetical protein
MLPIIWMKEQDIIALLPDWLVTLRYLESKLWNEA